MTNINLWPLIIAALIAYMLGSVSFSTIISRRFRNEDIRTKGSGNAGTANMLRNYGWKLGLATFAGDVLKGTLSALIGLWIAQQPGMYVGALFSVIGHCFSCFMKFKGGKGIATGIGAFLVIQPLATVIITLCCIGLVAITRIMSVGSMAGCVASAVAACILSVGSVWIVWWDVTAILIAVLCLWSHRANIVRLIHGEENRLSFGKRR